MKVSLLLIMLFGMFGFTQKAEARRLDPTTGMYMYKHRHYSPELGRWQSRDPIEERGGVNVYEYVRSNPVNKWDKLGLRWHNGQYTVRDFNPGWNDRVRSPIYGPPDLELPLNVAGSFVAGFTSDLDTDLWNHYIGGDSSDFNLTNKGNIGNIVKKHWVKDHDVVNVRFQKIAKSMTCAQGFGSSSYKFATIQHKRNLVTRRYASQNFSLGESTTGYEAELKAILTCRCDKQSGKFEPQDIMIVIQHKYYHYDQYADAADPKHWFDDVIEFTGGVQFDSIGHWGKEYTITYDWK